MTIIPNYNDTAVLLAFIEVESAFNRRAFLNDVNGGSYGLMQVDWRTSEDRGYKGLAIGLYDPAENVRWGVEQLRWLVQQLTRHSIEPTLDKVAWGYNMGLGNVLSGKTDTAYSDKIEAAYKQWIAVFDPQVV